MNKEVQDYLSKAPLEYQSDLQELRQMIITNLPQALETFQNGFPVYTINDIWCTGFAYRKKTVMFYLMRNEILDKYEKKLGSLRTGKSCVAYKGSKTLSKEALTELIQQMLGQIPETVSA